MLVTVSAVVTSATTVFLEVGLLPMYVSDLVATLVLDAIGWVVIKRTDGRRGLQSALLTRGEAPLPSHSKSVSLSVASAGVSLCKTGCVIRGFDLVHHDRLAKIKRQ